VPYLSSTQLNIISQAVIIESRILSNPEKMRQKKEKTKGVSEGRTYGWIGKKLGGLVDKNPKV